MLDRSQAKYSKFLIKIIFINKIKLPYFIFVETIWVDIFIQNILVQKCNLEKKYISKALAYFIDIDTV